MATQSSYTKAARENLIWSLQDFADYDRTVREWRGEDPKVRRSYDEDIALFFQTYQAEHFSLNGCRELGFTTAQCEAFESFVTMLSQYDRSVRTRQTVITEDVIKDARWREISKAAGDVLRAIEGNESR